MNFVAVIALQELTEEGVPFLILFHNTEDTDTPERFRQIVASELIEQKSKCLAVIAVHVCATTL